MAAPAATVRRGSGSTSSTSVSFTIVLAIVVITCSSIPPTTTAAKASAAAPCSSHTFSSTTNGGEPRLYGSCTDLPRLGATLHYNYTAATNTLAVAFRAPQATDGDDGWVAWGINPSGGGMVGTQAVVAFRHSNGTLVAYPTVLDSYAPSMAPAAADDLAFPVTDVAAEYAADAQEMVLYATLALPTTAGSGGKKEQQGTTKFTHVWQQGAKVVNDVPAAHPTSGDNILSTATIDFSD